MIFQHALRNALLPIITNIGARDAVPVRRRHRHRDDLLLAGHGPGIHRGDRNFDYPVLMGILVVTAVIVVFANLVADVIYAMADPRISYG